MYETYIATASQGHEKDKLFSDYYPGFDVAVVLLAFLWGLSGALHGARQPVRPPQGTTEEPIILQDTLLIYSVF